MNCLTKSYLNVKGYMWLFFIVISLIFIIFPQIDLLVASFFYNGKSFPLNGTLVESFFYYSVKPVIIGFVLLTVIIYFYNKITKKNILNITSKTIFYIMLVVGIAPGLIVNTTLKEHWGRPRPMQVKEFGGKLEFTPAFIMSKQDGYSFSSGHTAAAFSLMGFALLAHKRRRFWLSLTIVYGVAVSLARMAAGGHFLSDVVTSFFIVWIFTHLFYKLIFKEEI